MKVFKHKRTGEIIKYEYGVLITPTTRIEIGVEPNNEIWEEVIPIDDLKDGTKLLDIYTKQIYIKDGVIWKNVIEIQIDKEEIGNRFLIIKQ